MEKPLKDKGKSLKILSIKSKVIEVRVGDPRVHSNDGNLYLEVKPFEDFDLKIVNERIPEAIERYRKWLKANIPYFEKLTEFYGNGLEFLASAGLKYGGAVFRYSKIEEFYKPNGFAHRITSEEPELDEPLILEIIRNASFDGDQIPDLEQPNGTGTAWKS